MLQQNDAYCAQVQLQQNVSYFTSTSENHQQQQYVHVLYANSSNSSLELSNTTAHLQDGWLWRRSWSTYSATAEQCL